MRDIDELSGVEIPNYDICIIGSGPAGITLCAELAQTNLHICVLESGGTHKSRKGDELRRVISGGGIIIKDYSRERVIGGASSTWSGLSAPLDPMDMSERPFLKVPGWPISYQELEPYWEAAAERYRFPKNATFEEFSHLRRSSNIQPSWKNITEKVFLGAAKPQRFAKEFRQALDRKDVDLFYNATVLRLEGEKIGENNVVERAIVVSHNKREHIIKARVFVLATGGIENARLLLNSRNLCKNGLGNEYDQVGRYFMNHPKNNYGVVSLKKPVEDAAYFFGCLSQGYAGYAGLRLDDNIQRNRQVLNSYVRLEPIFPWSGNSGVGGAVFLAKKAEALLNIWKGSLSGKVVPLRDYSETGDDNPFQEEKNNMAGLIKAALAVLLHMPSVLQYAYARLIAKKKPAIKKIGMRNFMEMEPNPENRVILSSEKDPNGEFIPEVILESSKLDRRSLVELHKVLADELKKSGIGELESGLSEEGSWPINQDASHHMGTTRMGNDPMTSVVNDNLRLHSVENVYCSGASVFSTSGCANPTFTLCALSIRLAEHIKQQFA